MCRKPWVKEGSVAAAKVSAAIMGQGGKNLADIDHMSGIINHTVCSVPNSSSGLIFVKKGGDFDFLHISRIKSPWRCLGLFIAVKCVKSQNHTPFYTIKCSGLDSTNIAWFEQWLSNI